MSQVKRATAGLLATAVVGAISVATLPPATASGVAPQVAQSAQHSAPAAVPARRRVPSRFQVATYNVLGWSHTLNGARGYKGGVHRIYWAKRLLAKHGVDVAGFQEMQIPQLRRFLELAKGRWAVFPGTRLLERDAENSIGWRTDRFRLVDASTVKIPYFDGAPRTMPIVLLRDKSTGAMVYFSNFHNPTDNRKHPNQGHWRREATRVEVALTWQQWRSGIPRIMTGDMNERAEYFCRVTRNGTPLDCGTAGQHPGPRCLPPRPAPVRGLDLRLQLADLQQLHRGQRRDGQEHLRPPARGQHRDRQPATDASVLRQDPANALRSPDQLLRPAHGSRGASIPTP